MHRAANSPGTLLDCWHRTVTITSGHVGRYSKEPHGTEDTERPELEISARAGQGRAGHRSEHVGFKAAEATGSPSKQGSIREPHKGTGMPQQQQERRKENYGNRQNLQAAVSREQGLHGL